VRLRAALTDGVLIAVMAAVVLVTMGWAGFY
jgi:hypothetical protein